MTTRSELANHNVLFAKTSPSGHDNPGKTPSDLEKILKKYTVAR